MADKRGIHVHIMQTAGKPDIRWAVTRSLWSRGGSVRSGDLGRGVLEVTADGGTTHEVALELLRAVLVEFAALVDGASS